MRRSITFWKLFLGNLLVVAVVVALVGVLAYRRLDEDYQQRTRQDQRRMVQVVAGHFQDLWPLESARLDRMCKSMLADANGNAQGGTQGGGPAAAEFRLTVVAADGRVLGDSSEDPARMVNHRTPERPEILAALAGQVGEHVRYSETVGTEYRYMAVPLVRGGLPVAVVRLAVPVQTIVAGETFFRDALWAAALAAGVVAALLGLLVSWIWAAPLKRVSLVARQIAAGDFSRRARVEGRGELADLARAMNEMRDGLVGQIRKTEAQQQNLQTVLAGLREGILGIDAGGTVELLNEAAAGILSVKAGEAVGKKLQAVVPSLDIINLYQDASGQPRPAGAAPGAAPVTGQVEMDRDGARRILEVQAARTTSDASDIRGILVLRDVTELANAAAMKSQFVANASHELRTPLATVRAAVDALREVDPSERESLTRCMDILDRHVQRLEALTRDMLDLHMVESGKVPLLLREVPLGELGERMKAEFDARARDKDLRFTVSARPAEHVIRSDRALVELILRNLVDNAMKYTPAGGSVECTLEAAGTAGAVLCVRDTGVGISRQDQTRVFERFFQVDPARTGDARLRGTGLGLAIVKHASERLGAKVELQSVLGKGTAITVILPGEPGK